MKIVSNASEDQQQLGKFGEKMIEMLPNDLAFTVFVPSEEAFERDLKLWANDSLAAEKKMNDDDDTYAVLSRILGFSAVPRTIYSSTVDFGKEIDFDSLSGFRLDVRKEVDGMLVVNGVRSRRGDLRRGEIVVHVMDGVIMDADFQQSI